MERYKQRFKEAQYGGTPKKMDKYYVGDLVKTPTADRVKINKVYDIGNETYIDGKIHNNRRKIVGKVIKVNIKDIGLWDGAALRAFMYK